MQNLFEKIKRLQTMRGVGGISVHDSPGGRQIHRVSKEAEGKAATPSGGYYDVVAIGGWHDTPTSEADEVYPTVNSPTPTGYGEKNHVLASKQTAAEVNAGSWTWGDGYSMNNFAIAAIAYNTRLLIPSWDRKKDEEKPWWNPRVAPPILFARSWAENDTGDPITLTLTIGTIQPWKYPGW